MIGRIYRWLFDTHRHEWETIQEKTATLFRYHRINGVQQRIAVGTITVYTLRCKTCGDVSERRIGGDYT